MKRAYTLDEVRVRMDRSFHAAIRAVEEQDARAEEIRKICNGDVGLERTMFRDDVEIKTTGDSFNFHERIARLCADVIMTHISIGQASGNWLSRSNWQGR